LTFGNFITAVATEPMQKVKLPFDIIQ
jgi:hypothetical protein